MVTSKDSNTLWVSDLECNKEGDCLDGIIASINIITCALDVNAYQRPVDNICYTHEQVVGIWIWATDTEKLHEVMKLSMYIPTNCDWAFLECRSEPNVILYPALQSHLLLVVHSIHPAKPPEPIAICTYQASKQRARWMAIQTRSHSRCTSLSASCLQFIRLSIHPSKVGIDAGSAAGDS